MKRSKTRYKGVWDSGYRAAVEDINAGFLRFLRDGGQVQPSLFYGNEFTVKLPGGTVGTCQSLLAICAYGTRQIDERPPKP